MFTKPRQHGISMIELIMFIVIVSVGIVGILSVMTFSAKHSADPLIQKQALAIAESLLEEIELSDFNDPGAGNCNPCATRALFDDVADYNGYLTAGGIVSILNVAVPGLGSYNISPAVQVVAISAGELGAVPVASAKRITVNVTDPSGQVTTLTGYRTNY